MTILHIKFPNQYELASTFLRFQEHYESPKFQNKIFTHEEYFNWYAQEYGNMTYFSDWDGFNLPDYIFKSFFSCEFDPLWRKELHLLNLIDKNRPKNSLYYVIGTHNNGEDSLNHEILHGLYYLNKSYREAIHNTKTTFNISDLTKINNALYKKGYSKSVCTDELNAYALTGGHSWLPGHFSIKKSYIINRLHQVFEENFKFNLHKCPEKLSQFVKEINWKDI